jgi:hypothetical protein
MIGFEILDNEIKFINRNDKEVKVFISPRLKGCLYPVQSILKSFSPNEWFIPNIDYTGCCVVSVFDSETLKEIQRIVIPREFSKKSKSQNVICIGLNKSGTTSFHTGLQKLGYNLFPETTGHNVLLPDVYHNNFGTTISALENERYDLYQDMPYSLPNVYRKLYNFRPNDIYVLTVRNDVDNFVQSCLKFYKRHFDFGDIKKFDETLTFNFTHSSVVNINLINLWYAQFELWNITSFDNLEQKLKDVYNKHNDGVIDFFEKEKCSNFKVVNVSKQNEFKNFANWLGKETNENNFPWLNKS